MTEKEIDAYADKILNDFIENKLTLPDCTAILQSVLVEVFSQGIEKMGVMPYGVCEFTQKSTGKKYKLIIKMNGDGSNETRSREVL